MKLNIKEENKRAAAAIDELVANDWHLRLQLEAEDRALLDKQEANKKAEYKKAKEEAKKKKEHKNKLRRRVRRSGF